MSDKVYYKVYGSLYERYHGIFIYVEKPDSNATILEDTYDIEGPCHFTAKSEYGDAYYDNESYFKLVTKEGLEAYRRLGRYPAIPILVRHWPAGDKHMIEMTKLPGRALEADMLSNISGVDYHSVVSQVISFIKYTSILGVELDDRGNKYNTLYDSDTNTIYHLDIDGSVSGEFIRSIPQPSAGSIDLIFNLLWAKDSHIEEYTLERLPFDEWITNHPKVLIDYIDMLMSSAEDYHLLTAYESMRDYLEDN